ncbi:MAG: cell division/cell wall cluster transcriptional repressor MraZ [Acidimicrobiales bacterium]
MGPENSFFGRFDHSLDSKGRLILPARIRARLGSRCFLTPHLEGCVAIWTPETFQAEIDTREQSAIDTISRNQVREWCSAIDEIEIDSQGRILVAADLRNYAGLEREVLIVGVMDHVELWSPSKWNAKELVPTGASATTGA